MLFYWYRAWTTVIVHHVNCYLLLIFTGIISSTYESYRTLLSRINNSIIHKIPQSWKAERRRAKLKWNAIYHSRKFKWISVTSPNEWPMTVRFFKMYITAKLSLMFKYHHYKILIQISKGKTNSSVNYACMHIIFAKSACFLGLWRMSGIYGLTLWYLKIYNVYMTAKYISPTFGEMRQILIHTWTNRTQRVQHLGNRLPIKTALVLVIPLRMTTCQQVKVQLLSCMLSTDLNLWGQSMGGAFLRWLFELKHGHLQMPCLQNILIPFIF